jgi:hypothetical protein
MVEWIYLAQDGNRMQALVKTVMNILVLAPPIYLVSYCTNALSLKISEDFLQSTNLIGHSLSIQVMRQVQ